MEGSEGDAHNTSNDALFHVEDRGRKEEELVVIGEAGGDVDVVCKDVEDDRESRFSDGFRA